MIVPERNKKHFRYLTNRNLLWQYDFLIDCIYFGLPKKLKLTEYHTSAFNFFSIVNLAETPGAVRLDDVYIDGAKHEPPEAKEVKQSYLAFFPELHKVWDDWDAFKLAAFTLWRINWIHPFIDGNGRTARAAMYYVLSIKLGRVLKGKKTIPAQIRASPDRYYESLKAVDDSFKRGKLDLDPLADMLATMYKRQIDSAKHTSSRRSAAYRSPKARGRDRGRA